MPSVRDLSRYIPHGVAKLANYFELLEQLLSLNRNKSSSGTETDSSNNGGSKSATEAALTSYSKERRYSMD